MRGRASIALRRVNILGTSRVVTSLNRSVAAWPANIHAAVMDHELLDGPTQVRDPRRQIGQPSTVPARVGERALASVVADPRGKTVPHATPGAGGRRGAHEPSSNQLSVWAKRTTGNTGFPARFPLSRRPLKTARPRRTARRSRGTLASASLAPAAPVEEILHPSVEEWLTAVEQPARSTPADPPHLPTPRRRGARRILPSSPLLFDWLDRRFSPGEATLWVGPPSATEPLLELVYAGSVKAGGRVSLLEGTNRFHPYRVGETGRSLGLDPEHLLERIRLARAFTAYQMVALVDAWSLEVRRRHPTLLVAHEPSTLFLNDEVPEEERVPLLRHVAETLREVARTAHCPLLLSVTGGFSRFPGLKEHGPRWFDLVRLTPRSGGLRLEAYRDGSRLAIVPRPPGQRGLEEYGTDPVSEEVTTWAAPFRRTGKRWRNG